MIGDRWDFPEIEKLKRDMNLEWEMKDVVHPFFIKVIIILFIFTDYAIYAIAAYVLFTLICLLTLLFTKDE